MMHGCTHVNTLFLLLLLSAMNTTLPTYIEHKYKYLKCITNYIQTHAKCILHKIRAPSKWIKR